MTARQLTPVAQILALFESLGPGDRQVVVDELASRARLIAATRSGPVLDQLSRLLPKQPVWSIAEIRRELSLLGTVPAPRAIFNAIGYLARKQLIAREGRGRYRVLRDVNEGQPE